LNSQGLGGNRQQGKSETGNIEGYCIGITLSPLSGLRNLYVLSFRGLTPPATHCRPFGTLIPRLAEEAGYGRSRGMAPTIKARGPQAHPTIKPRGPQAHPTDLSYIFFNRLLTCADWIDAETPGTGPGAT